MMMKLYDRSVLSQYQLRFLKGRSTTGALLSAIDSWHQSLEIWSEVCAFFLDLAKAFEYVYPYLIRWLGTYLFGMFVVVNGEYSMKAHGVLQGSVLGPLLFLTYINEVSGFASDKNLIFFFADDILMYQEKTSLSDHVQVQLFLDSISAWFTKNT